MDGAYTTIYLRNTFDIASLTGFNKLVLEVKFDDGVNIWLNGKLVHQENVASAELPYNAVSLSTIEDSSWRQYDLGDPRSRLVQGKNVIAVQVVNCLLSNSSDCFVDVRLVAQQSQGGGRSARDPRGILQGPGQV